MLAFIGFACVIAFHYYAAKKYGMSAVLWAILGAVLPLISTSALIYIIFQPRKYIGLPTFQEYLELHPKSPEDQTYTAHRAVPVRLDNGASVARRTRAASTSAKAAIPASFARVSEFIPALMVSCES